MSGGTFGKLFTANVDGQVYAQPLVSQGTLLVATETNKVYGLDPATGAQKWARNVGTPFNASDIGCADLTPTIGITGTPVIDPQNNIAYFADKTYANGASGPAMWQLHAIDVATGAEQPNFPVTIQGVAQNQPARVFPPTTQMQRPGLLLLNGVVYVGFGSHCDISPWAGWIAGVTTGGQLRTMWSSIGTSNLGGAGIWQAGSGLTSDGTHIYISTGNGAVSQTLTKPLPGSTPPLDLGQSVVRLDVQSDGSLKARDFFAPFDALPLDANDQDLGSAGPVALPPQFGAGTSTPNLMVQNGKEGYVYLLNRDSLGGFQQGPSNGDAVVNRAGPFGGVWGRAGVWPGDGGYIYYVTSTGVGAGLSGNLRAYKYGVDGGNNPTLSLVATSPDAFGFGSSSPVITSNGTDSGTALVWVVWSANGNGTNAQLRAYDPVPVNGALPLRYSAPIGTSSKFNTPGVSGNRIYVGTRDGTVVGFGSPVTAPASAHSVQFPSTTVGQSTTKDVTFTANRPLSVSAFSSNSSQFTVGDPAAPLPASLTDGGTITVPVTFTPTTTGLESGTITMTTDQGLATGSVSGTGQSATPLLAAQPAFLSMEGVPTNGTPATGSITLTNVGAQPLTIESSTAPSAPFSAEGLPAAGTTMAPNASLSINVSFAPTAPGTYQDEVTVDSTGGEVSVPITGQSGTPQAMTLSQTAVHIGTVAANGSATGSFTITNTGGSPLTVTKSKPPALAVGFSAITSLPEGTTIPPGGELTETVRFTAGATLGIASDQWVITSDDGSGAQTVTFDATKVAAQAIPGPLAGGWTLNGTAAIAPPILQLTAPDQSPAAGSAFAPATVQSQYVRVAFDALIDSGSGADGLALTFADPTAGATPKALGTSGGGLGFSGIPGVAVALDTFQASGNPSDNFVGVSDGGLTPGSDILHWLATSTNVPFLRQAPAHVVVTLANGAITVTVNGTDVIVQPVSLPPRVLVGFTGGNGGLADRHAVANVAITSVAPTLTVTNTVLAPAGASQGAATSTYSGTCPNSFTTAAIGTGKQATPAGTGGVGSQCTVTEANPGLGWSTFVSVNGGPSQAARTASFTLADGANTVAFTNEFLPTVAAPLPAPTSAGWKFNGSAKMVGTGLETTPVTKSVKGTAFWPTGVTSANLHVAFDARLTGGTGGEGMSLVLADTAKGATAASLGGVGGLLGFGGISGLAVALDTHKNATDPSSNFVGISNGKSKTSGALSWIATSTLVPSLRAASVHVDVFVTAPGLLVLVNGSVVLSTAVVVPANVLVGFSGATGSLTDGHTVSNVAVTRTIPGVTPPRWHLNGSATIAPPALQLTDAATAGAAGSAFFSTPVASNYVKVAFDAAIGGGSGADGLTLTFANAAAGATPSSLGTAGGGLGFSGIPGVAVALDTYQNAANPSANFVGITDGGLTPASDQLHWLATTNAVPQLRGTPVHVVALLANGVITVLVNGRQVLTKAVSVSSQVLIGFTGGNGGITDRHAVSNVAVTLS